MATPEQTPYNTYLGNGVTTEFSIGFDYTDTDSVKVYIKRSGGEEELLPNTDYSFVNATTLKFPASGSSETVLANGDVLTVQRETAVENDFVFSNQKRLFPEDVMEADDNEMRILQEHARQLGRALVLPPTSQVDPDDVIGQVERVYDSIDNIDTVADNIGDVNNVSDNMTKVSNVSSNMTSVSGVYSNMSKITSVYNNRTNITAVANNSTNINTVAGDKANIDAVAGDISNIDAVAGNATNINAVNANKTNINTVASNISKVNNVSTNMAKVTGVYDNRSAITAVNSNATNINSCANNMVAILDAPNQAASAAASAELSAQYANDKINQTHITNCITEIPQDITLELSSGTITLKSGSTITAPDGTQYTTTEGKTFTASGSSTYTGFLIVSKNTGNIQGVTDTSVVGSGSSLPADGSTYTLFLNTTDDKIYRWASTAWSVWSVALPLAICTVTDGVITSIDQVFNGFGYMGSTVFVLPGVKFLVPKGKNNDGTMKSTLTTISSLMKKDISGTYIGRPLILRNNDIGIANVTYNESTNYNTYTSYCIVGYVDISSGTITKLNTKQPFHASDYCETVRTNGDQYIGGVKTFTTNIYMLTSGTSGRLYSNSTALDLTEASRTNDIGIGFRATDKNGNIGGEFTNVFTTAGTSSAVMQVRNRASGSQTTAQMKINVDKNGNISTECPTPTSASDNSTKIATTAWIWIFLKGISGYSASVNQTLTHDTSGNFKWVNS